MKDRATNDLIKILEKAPREELSVLYKRHGIDPSGGVEILVEEILLDGSNTIFSIFSVGALSYLEIVKDVAGKFGVKVEKSDTEITLERKIIGSIIKKYIDNCSEDEMKEVKELLDKECAKYKADNLAALLISGTVIGAVSLIKPAAISAVIKTLIGQMAFYHTSKEVAKRGLMTMGYAVPFLNAIMASWAIIELAGPAYRKIIPTVIDITLLRMELENGVEKAN